MQEGPYAGKVWYETPTVMLQTRALLAYMAEVPDAEREADKAALRTWLPSVEELLRITHTTQYCRCVMQGAAHPTLMCARLHGERLGAWADAVTVIEAVLDTPPLSLCPLAVIEAWRLLARCRRALGEDARAREALETAAATAKAVKYVYAEAVCLQDLLEWAEDEVARAAVQARIEAVTAMYVCA